MSGYGPAAGHLVWDQAVGGSIPPTPTKKIRRKGSEINRLPPYSDMNIQSIGGYAEMGDFGSGNMSLLWVAISIPSTMTMMRSNTST